ncbi:hypothetical protein VFPPC_16867 [Pochonia chlamydosporia 170]|uniref:Uncharacterized protein n=1 Tax=Pochonia chlamydosporia 170 TaxID=1380566 RepID=A0A179F218_METCM|nr:hypothetical protein VFPPC_16867 [Pochonia chlamydosporia 170]OAQ59330.2 hypothetical protein VFPPC_16867 [Pochonia chlamydosporia 170]
MLSSVCSEARRGCKGSVDSGSRALVRSGRCRSNCVLRYRNVRMMRYRSTSEDSRVASELSAMLLEGVRDKQVGKV